MALVGNYSVKVLEQTLVNETPMTRAVLMKTQSDNGSVVVNGSDRLELRFETSNQAMSLNDTFSISFVKDA